MLQEAKEMITSAFQDSFIKRLSLYLHDCVREEVKSSTFRNLKQDKENKWIFLNGEEEIFHNFPININLDGADANLTELMLQSEMSQKDKYLIYGYLFLIGKNSKTKRYNEFLTPLLYMNAKLEREGKYITCSVQDEVLSLNTGALANLMKKSDDEDEMEHMLEGLLDVVPDLPLTQEKLDIFLTTLRSLVPDLEICFNHEEDEKEIHVKDENTMITGDNVEDFIDEEEEPTKKNNVKIDKVILTNQFAVILTKRPNVTAGVLHELTQIAEKPFGVFRETALGVINEEYLRGKGKIIDKNQKEQKNLKDFVAITPLNLSDSQEDVIRKIENNSLVAVYGPPGTGKSQTIVNLASHLIANGKTVLVASRMDKAVDVVAERLNELGAPFLALRAGRLNYQKQLSFHLQDLLSNKVDIDTGFEDAILVDVDDMRELVKKINELEHKCEEIIAQEQTWQQVFQEKQNEFNLIKNMLFINKILRKDEIDILEKIIEKFEKNSEKTGFFVGLSNYLGKMKLSKILKIKDFNIDFENLERLKQELKISSLDYLTRVIELKMHKIGNLQTILEQIKTLKKKQRKLAVNILKRQRREALKGLLREQSKRQRLIVHTKAILERKKNLQNRLLETEDFSPLLDAFPCWGVTTYAISGSIPMKPGLFDVAIIDEASQCDIASCFPILFRAKKAVIVGDDKQLPHLSFLEKTKEQSFLSQYNIPDKYQLMWRFRTNSMFDLANYYSTSPVLLDEHFRSLKQIIEFSNNEFYGGRIRIMNKNVNEKNVLELHCVSDGKIDWGATQNMPETEAVLKRLQELIIEDEKSNNIEPISIGIISPFRAQVEMIKKAVMQVLPESQILRHKIEVGTAHTFQGDERDIIILSWTFAPNSHPQSLTFLQKPNLFNVAITRARKKLICFISKDPKTLPEGLLRSYLEYISSWELKDKSNYNEAFENDFYKNNLEKEIAEEIRKKGLKVNAGVDIAGLSTDLTIKDNKGNELLIEVDGVEDSKKIYISQMKKQTILERCGFKVLRISFREWQISKMACLNRIFQEFDLKTEEYV